MVETMGVEPTTFALRMGSLFSCWQESLDRLLQHKAREASLVAEEICITLSFIDRQIAGCSLVGQFE